MDSRRDVILPSMKTTLIMGLKHPVNPGVNRGAFQAFSLHLQSMGKVNLVLILEDSRIFQVVTSI